MKSLYLSMLLLFTASLYAQTTVTGTVTSAEDNTTIPFVNVLVEGTNQGTITDENGVYTITIPTDVSVLKFSSLGYSSQLITVAGRTQIDVALSISQEGLDEVVVTATKFATNKKDVIFKAENESRVQTFVQDFPGYEVVTTLSIAPHAQGDGFYLTQMRRVS